MINVYDEWYEVSSITDREVFCLSFFLVLLWEFLFPMHTNGNRFKPYAIEFGSINVRLLTIRRWQRKGSLKKNDRENQCCERKEHERWRDSLPLCVLSTLQKRRYFLSQVNKRQLEKIQSLPFDDINGRQPTSIKHKTISFIQVVLWSSLDWHHRKIWILRLRIFQFSCTSWGQTGMRKKE